MIDPPSQVPGSDERRAELEQTVDIAIQFLLEEAQSVGWTPAEFLTAVTEAADTRLATLQGQPSQDSAAKDGSA